MKFFGRIWGPKTYVDPRVKGMIVMPECDVPIDLESMAPGDFPAPAPRVVVVRVEGVGESHTNDTEAPANVSSSRLGLGDAQRP